MRYRNLAPCLLLTVLFACGEDEPVVYPKDMAYVEIQSDYKWELGAYWVEQGYGVVLRREPGLGDQVVAISSYHDQPGRYCASVIRNARTRFVRVRVVVPFNPRGVRQTELATLAPPDTALTVCLDGHP